MTYDALAQIYDRLMSFVSYGEWTDLINRVVAKYAKCANGAKTKGKSNINILELGAGTGVVGAHLLGMGHNYAACDLSFGMCGVAKKDRGIPICNADARALPFKKKFDLTIFLYDGINYLLSRDDYQKMFSQVYDALAPNGLFLFDITTRHNSLTYFEDFLDFEDYGDCSYVRHSYFDKRTSCQHNDFTIYAKAKNCNGHYEKFVDRHKQKLFTVSELESFIPKDKFETLGIWDGYTFRKYTGKSVRIHFLLRKKEVAA